MNKLSDRICHMISKAAKTFGKTYDMYYYIEEDLYADESEEIFDFIKYLVDNDIHFVEGSLNDEFIRYKKLEN